MLAVSHDPRLTSAADRVLRLVGGRIGSRPPTRATVIDGSRAVQHDLERAGLAGPREHVVGLLELVECEVVRRERARVELVAGEQLEERRRRERVDEAGRDRHVLDPERLEVQRRRLAVHADVGDVAAGAGERDGELERGRGPDRLDRDVGAEAVGEAAHDLERVLVRRVDHDVGAELLGGLQPAGREVDRDDVARAEQPRAHDRREPDRARADDRDDVARARRAR